MNVLITSASRKASLVSAFQRALAEEGGGKVIAIDTSPFAAALYVADEHYLVPASQEPKFLAALLRLCRESKIDLIVPTRDEELPLFAEHKQEFAEIGTSIMVSDLSAVRTCQDKRMFIRFCEENGFAVPKSYDIADLSADTFPVFARARRGKGGRTAVRINSKKGLESVLEEMPDAIIQEFVDAPEYTIDLFADLSGRVISVVPRQRIHIVGGESFVGRTERNQLLIREGARLARALGLIGHNTIQCFLDGELVKFIEVNPRFGGGANLGFAAGAPTPLFLVRLLRGERVEARIGEFKDNYFMLRYTEDVFLDASALGTATLE